MRIVLFISITLIASLQLMGQKLFRIANSELQFSTNVNLVEISNSPGIAEFKGTNLKISILAVEPLSYSGIEEMLIKDLENQSLRVTSKFSISNTDKQEGTFVFASKSGDDSEIVKGVISNPDEMVAIEIIYKSGLNNTVEDIITSFFSKPKQCPTTTKPGSDINASNASVAQLEDDDDDEYFQKYDYDQGYNQVDKANESGQPNSRDQVPSIPKVTHQNLITLTTAQKQEFIDAHNRWRADVGVPPLKWNENLENYAAEWAVINGKKGCKMVHRDKSPYGENLYWSSGMAFSPKGSVDSWGSEIKDYNHEPVGQEKAMVGHYTQIVWRTTTEVGCAAFECGKALLVVCNYNPPGNWVGQHPYR